jgi:3',5'-cyclic AMP phosphodiesterase CpdA
MADALVTEARARGADVLIAGGDVSSEARPAEVAAAKNHLDAFGKQGEKYLVVRGNHDRPHNNAESAGCSPVAGHADYHDCFRDAFFPSSGPSWWTEDVFGMRVLGLDTYDSLGSGGDNGVLSAAQMSFVRAELARDRNQPTLVIGHHPVTRVSDLTTVPPITFDMNQEQARQLERLYGQTPGVFLHHSGHTHRNKRTAASAAPGVVFQEVSAVKEYPGGFMLLRVFTGGYAANFYKFRSLLAREWSERTRQAYFGGYPFYVSGTIADRNYMEARDFSGLQKDRPASPRPAQDGSDDDGPVLAATGGAVGLAAAAGTACLAAAATQEWLRRKAP